MVLSLEREEQRQAPTERSEANRATVMPKIDNFFSAASIPNTNMVACAISDDADSRGQFQFSRSHLARFNLDDF